jgi:hypothetical protein
VVDAEFDLGEERGLIKGNLRKQDDVGSLIGLAPARPPAAAIQPAWRPITSSTNTLVEVRAIDATSMAASRVETAMYLATEPNPGQQSVCGRSLSTVFGTPTQVIG